MLTRRTLSVFVFVLVVAIICEAQPSATIIGTLSSSGYGNVSPARALLREYSKFHGAIGRIVRTSTVNSEGHFHFLGVPPAAGYLIEIERPAGSRLYGAISDVRSGETINLRGEIRWPRVPAINWIQNRRDDAIVFRDPPRPRHNWIFICE